MYLAVVYYENDENKIPKIYVEYKPEQFKQVLLEEFDKVKDVARAFERTCIKLKNVTTTME